GHDTDGTRRRDRHPYRGRSPDDARRRARGVVDGADEHAVLDRVALRRAWLGSRGRDQRAGAVLSYGSGGLSLLLRLRLRTRRAAFLDPLAIGQRVLHRLELRELGAPVRLDVLTELGIGRL